MSDIPTKRTGTNISVTIDEIKRATPWKNRFVHMATTAKIALADKKNKPMTDQQVR